MCGYVNLPIYHLRVQYTILTIFGMVFFFANTQIKLYMKWNTQTRTNLKYTEKGAQRRGGPNTHVYGIGQFAWGCAICESWILICDALRCDHEKIATCAHIIFAILNSPTGELNVGRRPFLFIGFAAPFYRCAPFRPYAPLPAHIQTICIYI